VSATDLPLVGGKAPVLRRPWDAPRIGRWIGGLIITAIVLGQAYHFVGVDPGEMIGGFAGIFNILRQGMPPDLTVLGDGLQEALVSIDIAILGTVAATLVSVPLAICAAENVTPAHWAYVISRGIIGVTRAIPDIVFALLFVAAVGLGPFPGCLGLGVHSVGILGRLYAEAIEDMDMGPVQALRSAGASPVQIASQAVIPGVIPTLIGVTLYRLDTNVRSTLALGFVGGGGLGFLIFESLELFMFRQLATYLIIMLVMVMMVEVLAVYLRRWIR
jgi:phosphonate transport system permease protein